MSATTRDGEKVETTGDGTTGRTQSSRDGSVCQTDGDQFIINDD